MKPETFELCSPDLAARLNDWWRYIRYEKRLSQNTTRAYANDNIQENVLALMISQRQTLEILDPIFQKEVLMVLVLRPGQDPYQV